MALFRLKITFNINDTIFQFLFHKKNIKLGGCKAASHALFKFTSLAFTALMFKILRY